MPRDERTRTGYLDGPKERFLWHGWTGFTCVPAASCEAGILFSSNYLPHRFCYLAEPSLVWTNAISDGLIAISYSVLFCCLAGLVMGWRRVAELRNYLWIFASFAVFILACGTTHLMDVVTVWVPVYPLSAAFKVVCALVSVPTAILFARRTPAISRSLAGSLSLISAERLASIEALRKTEALLDRTGRLAGVGGWELELGSMELTLSAETFRIFGFDAEHQPTMDEMLAVYTPASKEALLAALEVARRDGIGWSTELEAQRQNGQRIWVRCVGAVDRRAGRHARISVALQDITTQLERQQALRKSEVLLDRTGRLAGVGGWELDLKTQVLTWSAENCRIMGAPEDFVPELQPAIDMYAPGSRERLIVAYEIARDGGAGWDLELEVDRVDGRRIWVRVMGTVEMEGGKPCRLNGALQDITAQVARREELRRANERVALATASGRIGIWDWEVQNQVLTWDAWTYRLYGLDPDAEPASYSLWARHLHPEDAPFAEAAVARALEDGTPLDFEFRMVWPDGSLHHIHCAGRVTADSAGKAVRLLGVIRDVTKERELTAETERLMKLELKLRDDFLTHVSHELRSPLTSICSFTSIIADGLAGETTPEQQEYLGIVMKNSAQLQAMIEDLLDVAQSRDGGLSIAARAISCSEAILDSMQTLSGAAAAKRIALSRGNCDDLPLVYADPTRLRQVLIILLDNAIKFTPEGGRVDIEVGDMRADSLLIQISDTGCGIPKEDLDKVFEHLYQIGASDNAGRNGLGLGLHIARDLVMRQGGKSWASSEVGKGSVFSFTVPLYLGHHPEPHTQKARVVIDGTRDRKLIVQ